MKFFSALVGNMNIAVLFVVCTAVAIAVVSYWLWGRPRTPDTFVAEEEEEETSTKPPTTNPEFSDHMIYNNVYSRIYEAYGSVFGGEKPSLDDVDHVVSAYRDGKVDIEGFENFIANRSTAAAVITGAEEETLDAEYAEDGGDDAEDGGDDAEDDGDGKTGYSLVDAADAVRLAISRALKLVGVVVSDETIKIAADRVRQGMATIKDIVREQLQKI